MASGSTLEFRLHRLQFTELIKQGHVKQSEALAYAKNFAAFANTHAKGNEKTREERNGEARVIT